MSRGFKGIPTGPIRALGLRVPASLASPSPVWWGRFEIPDEQAGRWRIGPLRLWIEHKSTEWRLAYDQLDDPLDSSVEVAAPIEPELPPEDVSIKRFGTTRESDWIHVRPMMADRSVVSRPELPFHVLGNDEAEVFVNTPIWVQVATDDPPDTLLDLPTTRPSDTWFGPSTRVGELCYYSRTAARLHLENVPLRPSRATTLVHLVNRARDPIRLERINLPAPDLSLWVDASGRFWTEAVTMERDTDGVGVDVRLGKGPPPFAGKAELVSGPRHTERRSALVRALSAFLG